MSDKYRLIVKRKGGQDGWTFERDEMVKVCIALCGGGWTETQTKNAMMAVNDIQDGDGYSTKRKGNLWTIKKETT